MELKIVLEKCVENFEPNPNLAWRGAVNQTWNSLQPLTNSRLLSGTLVAGQCRAEVLFQGHRLIAAGFDPGLEQAERGEAVFLLLPECLLAARQVILH